MEAYVIVRQVNKSFKETQALKDVTVSFEQGKIHGLIGRNGSGKTVLLKCICGFMRQDSGDIFVNGKPVRTSEAQDCGIIIEEPGFINSVSGFRNLKILASIRRRISDERIRETMELVGLDPGSKKAVGKYSLGMRHRLGIAQAIMEDPPLLLLDEPMNGLDRQGVEEIRKLLCRLKSEGKTILLSSHYAEDIDVLCDTVCEMDGGILTRRESLKLRRSLNR